MKKFIAFLMLAGTFVFSACEKETSVENPLDNVSGSFTADIDGTPWSATLKSAEREGGRITLFGETSDGKAITLIVGDTGVHSYSLSSTDPINVGIYEDSAVQPVATWSTNQWFIPGTYGDVNITRIDTVNKTMSGTFAMNVFRSLDGLQRQITNGRFNNIPYTGTSVNVPLDTFNVKIDGAPFTYTSLLASAFSGEIAITATDGATIPRVSLTFAEDITPGTYNFNADAAGLYITAAGDPTFSESGTLTVLENNTITRRIRGTFSFIANDGTGVPPDYNFTEGYFSVSY